MSLHSVPLTFMKFNELACRFMSLYAVPFVVCAAHKNFAVLVYQSTPSCLKFRVGVGGGGPCDYCVSPVQRIGFWGFFRLGRA